MVGDEQWYCWQIDNRSEKMGESGHWSSSYGLGRGEEGPIKILLAETSRNQLERT